MDVQSISEIWSQPNLNFYNALPELEKTYSDFCDSQGIHRRTEDIYEIAKELMVRLTAVTLRLYIEELRKNADEVKNMGFAEGQNHFASLKEKGRRLENIIKRIEKKPQEELYFLEQLQIANQTSMTTAFSQLSNAKPKSSKGACYIATMCYGSYDHPQVIKLRNFRDDRLDKSQFGRMLISIYYKYSPKLVKHLDNNKIANSFLKKLLNSIIAFIEKK